MVVVEEAGTAALNDKIDTLQEELAQTRKDSDRKDRHIKQLESDIKDLQVTQTKLEVAVETAKVDLRSARRQLAAKASKRNSVSPPRHTKPVTRPAATHSEFSFRSETSDSAQVGEEESVAEKAHEDRAMQQTQLQQKKKRAAPKATKVKKKKKQPLPSLLSDSEEQRELNNSGAEEETQQENAVEAKAAASSTSTARSSNGRARAHVNYDEAAGTDAMMANNQRILNGMNSSVRAAHALDALLKLHVWCPCTINRPLITMHD